MFHKLSLFVVVLSLSVSAFADVGGHAREAAPKNIKTLHEQIFKLLSNGSIKETEVVGSDVATMVFERKDKVTCDTKALVCRDSKNKRVTGEVAKEIIRLIPQDATNRKGLGGTKISIERGEILCVATQYVSGEIDYDCK